MKRSSVIGYWLLKCFGVLAAPLALMLIHGLTFPDSSVIEGLNTEVRDQVWGTLIIFALLLSLISYVTVFRLREIEYDENGIRLLKDCEWYDWKKIKSVIKIPFCTPPIYRISFKGNRRPIYLIMSMKSISVGVYSWDFSDFYRLAREKTS